MRACVRACARACVCWGGGGGRVYAYVIMHVESVCAENSEVLTTRTLIGNSPLPWCNVANPSYHTASATQCTYALVPQTPNLHELTVCASVDATCLITSSRT